MEMRLPMVCHVCGIPTGMMQNLNADAAASAPALFKPVCANHATLYTFSSSHSVGTPPGDAVDFVNEVTTERDRLAAENARLRAALKPFADDAAKRPWITNLSEASGLDEFNIGGSGLTNGDLRRAAELLKEVPRAES